MRRKLAIAAVATAAVPVTCTVVPVVTAGPAEAAGGCTSDYAYLQQNGAAFYYNTPYEYLEVYHSSTANGATVDEWTLNRTNTQWWCDLYSQSYDGHNVFELVNYNSGKCLEVYHSDTANGAKVDQWSCNNTLTQWWYVVPGGWSDWAELKNLNSGKCLTPLDGNNVTGTAMVQEPCAPDTPGEEWTASGPAA